MITQPQSNSNTPSNTQMKSFTKLQIIEAMQAIITEADDHEFSDHAECLVIDILNLLDAPPTPIETIITPFGFVPLLGTVEHDNDLGPVVHWNGATDE